MTQAPANPTGNDAQQPASANPTIALVGNPNTGKSTLFNRLTGARQRVGNYPGVTVEKHVGQTRIGDRALTVIDLPGAYSLAAISADERIVLDVITGAMENTKTPDVVVCVVDATHLMRNLFLASQIADTGAPMVIALNLHDAARKLGMQIDCNLLSKQLGIPVVPTVAPRGEGVDELKKAITDTLDNPRTMRNVNWPHPVQQAVNHLQESVVKQTGQFIDRTQAMRMLFDVDSAVAERFTWTPQQRDQHIAEARAILRDAGHDPTNVESHLRYAFLREQAGCALHCPLQKPWTRSESIDNLLTHRFWGLLIFIGVMFVMFWSIYSWAGPMMDLIDAAAGAIGDAVAPMLENMPMLQSLVVDGVIAGVGGVVVFLPQILILFFFLALLEDTGYMARAAFLMDKLFSWAGLSGKSFVPLLSSYACAIPGVMATRTIEDPKSRLTTILIAPMMSCSARLPVYVLMIGAFVEPSYGPLVAAWVLFGMHMLGLAIGLPIAFILNKLILKTKPSPFFLEMPSYRVPQLRDVTWKMWERGREFLIRAGTVIFAFTIIIWALCYFPRPDTVAQQVEQTYLATQPVQTVDALDEDQLARLEQLTEGAFIEQSYMGRMGKFIQPVFAPAGFDWKITVGVVSSFPAREVIIATLGIIYNLGGDVDEESEGLIARMQAARHPSGEPVFNIPVAMSIMVFFALCMQCGATVAVVAREASWKWAIIQFTYMTTLAWAGAVITYQVGMAIAS